MNRKIISIAAVLFVLLLFTGCGKKNFADPYDVRALDTAEILKGEESGIKARGFAADLCVPETEDRNTENVNAEAFGLFSVDGEDVISQKSLFEKVYPASTTKIMTCLLALEMCDLSEYVTVPEESVITVSGSSMADLKPGDRMTMEDMLHALMVPSGNDAAVAIACHIAGSIENFAELMNKKARSMGATGTHFVNPHGLPDEEHYTTVYDMYLIFNEAIKNEDFCRISGTGQYSATYTNSKYVETEGDFHKESTWTSGNGFYNGSFTLPSGLSYFAGKTGHTNAAGFCLVLGEKDTQGKKYISIIMKAGTYEDLYHGMISLTDKISL